MKVVRYWPRAVTGDGGITGSVRRWSRCLAREGVDCTIAYDEEGPVPDIPGVRWHHVQHAGPAGWNVPLDLERVIAGADLLVLHSGWNLPNIAAGRAARSLGVPFLLEPRGAYDPWIVARHPNRKHLWFTAFEHGLMEAAAAIHVFFECETTHLGALAYHGRTIHAPNGIDVPAETPRRTGRGEYLLWLGRFDPEHKGLEQLLAALALLSPRERPPTRLHGPDWRGGKARTEQLVRKLRLQDSVTLGGPVYDGEKRQLTAAAAAFVYPSRWEAFGNALAEAVALAVPTLATPYPLARHLAAADVTVLAPPTAEGLAEGIRHVLSDEAVTMANRGPDFLRENFAWPIVARQWLEQAGGIV